MGCSVFVAQKLNEKDISSNGGIIPSERTWNSKPVPHFFLPAVGIMFLFIYLKYLYPALLSIKNSGATYKNLIKYNKIRRTTETQQRDKTIS